MKPGDEIDRYVIEAEIGRGGMGEVYAATDTRLGRRVALKLLRVDADGLGKQRMLREARAVASFEHPNAVTVFDVGEADGTTFIAMELIRGESLRRHVGDRSIPWAVKVRWLADAARALGAAHRAGLVHRDVKPDNVMVKDDGVVKVLDFGIARAQRRDVDPSAPTEAGSLPTLTREGLIVGTPLYASPEQLRGEALDGRSDQFSWGVTAYELLAGRVPWSAGAESVALISQILSAEAPPLHDVDAMLPEGLAAVVARALSKAKAERFPEFDDLARALEPFVEPRSPSSTVSAEAGRSARAPASADTPVRALEAPVLVGRRRRVAPWLIVLGALAVGVGAFVGLRRARPVVHAIACREATIEGRASDPRLARAIGYAACARLGTALGASWDAEGAPPLEVSASFESGEVKTRLALGDARATASGHTALEAVASAVLELEKRVDGPPTTDADRLAWGAKDDAAARRIRRVVRYVDAGLEPDADAAISSLQKSDPDSPWPHAMVVLALRRSTESMEVERVKALELVGALPEPRRDALRALLLYLGREEDRPAALELARKAYAADPDDPEVASAYADLARFRGVAEEGHAVVERLQRRSPTQAIAAIETMLSSRYGADPERTARYVDALAATLPEATARPEVILSLVDAGRTDGARAALALGSELGLAGVVTGGADLARARVAVELASFDGKAARLLAASMFGDPKPAVSADGARGAIASYWVEGRADEALVALAAEIERQRQLGRSRDVATLVLAYARASRWLGREIDAGLLAQADEIVARDTFHAPPVLAGMRARLAIARDPGDKGEAIRRTLEALEHDASRAPGSDAVTQSGIRLATLGLVAAARGDDEAALVWSSTARARASLRADWAFEAGRALERLGRSEEAANAYRIAAAPASLDTDALFVVLAHLGLARVERALGHADASEHEAALVRRAWAHADADLLARGSRAD